MVPVLDSHRERKREMFLLGLDFDHFLHATIEQRVPIPYTV